MSMNLGRKAFEGTQRGRVLLSGCWCCSGLNSSVLSFELHIVCLLLFYFSVIWLSPYFHIKKKRKKKNIRLIYDCQFPADKNVFCPAMLATASCSECTMLLPMAARTDTGPGDPESRISSDRIWMNRFIFAREQTNLTLQNCIHHNQSPVCNKTTAE